MRVSWENFVDAKKLVRIKEIIELWEAKLQQVNCILYSNPLTFDISTVQKGQVHVICLFLSPSSLS